MKSPQFSLPRPNSKSEQKICKGKSEQNELKARKSSPFKIIDFLASSTAAAAASTTLFLFYYSLQGGSSFHSNQESVN